MLKVNGPALKIFLFMLYVSINFAPKSSINSLNTLCLTFCYIKASEIKFYLVIKGWSGGAMVQGKFQVPGRPTIWILVGQGPSALAVDAGGGCLDIFFSRLSLFFSFSVSLGDGLIQTEILSQRAVMSKTTNQPIILSFKCQSNPRSPYEQS